jgi:hypothetical protein
MNGKTLLPRLKRHYFKEYAYYEHKTHKLLKAATFLHLIFELKTESTLSQKTVDSCSYYRFYPTVKKIEIVFA